MDPKDIYLISDAFLPFQFSGFLFSESSFLFLKVLVLKIHLRRLGFSHGL
jgi:hypothetical protein